MIETNAPQATTGIIVSWVRRHGRSAGIARELGIEEVNIWLPGPGGTIGRYIRSFRETRRVIRSTRPRIVVVMQPPLPAFWAARGAARRSAATLATDLHTGAFDDPKWRWGVSGVLRAIRGAGFAIVTNEDLARTVRDHGVRAIVCHDPIDPPYDTADEEVPPWGDRLDGRPVVLVPFAWAYDEPTAAALAAARREDRFLWIFTGKKGSEAQDLPEHVLAPGFVADAQYRWLFRRADVVCALTTQEDTMQRVGYEAISNGKALVTSGTRVLKEYFEVAALYTQTDAMDLDLVVAQAVEERDVLSRRMEAMRATRLGEERQAIGMLRQWIEQDD